MPTSVTIDENLRKKIIKLADELDLSQEDILKQAVEMFEEQLAREESRDETARALMKQAAEKRKCIEWRKKIRAHLSKPGIDIDDVRIAKWSEVDEDSSR